MRKRGWHPDDDAHLSADEAREFEELAANIGPLTLDGAPPLHAGSGPRDYSPPDDPDDERYVPPPPPPVTTPWQIQAPWW
ncbi:MAG: hypothetical protein Q4Q03_08610, partial [Bowdeniella nasicola]|nr:hypothetical protein [Bowdeniella nasicola]